jgi:hypothetical protein
MTTYARAATIAGMLSFESMFDCTPATAYAPDPVIAEMTFFDCVMKP